MSISKQNNTAIKITVNEAIQQTKNWRGLIQNVFPNLDPKLLPKAVFISKADIVALAQLFEDDETLIGVRTYFTLEQPVKVWPAKNPVKFCLVPVRDTTGYPNGQDLLYVDVTDSNEEAQEQAAGDPDNLDDSNVFDFTAPCPDFCDIKSELFSEQP